MVNKKRKYIFTFTVFIISILLLTACSNNSRTDPIEAEPPKREVPVGHYSYYVPETCEVKASDSELDLAGDTTVIGDRYVIRSYFVSGVPVDLEEAMELLYPNERLIFEEIGKADTDAYVRCVETGNTEGEAMYTYTYHFIHDGVLHFVEMWSYSEMLSQEAVDIVDSIEQTYISEDEAKMKAAYEQAMEELENTYVYEQEPEDPPSYARIGRPR